MQGQNTYDFAIEIVLADHDRVDSFGVNKVEERETSRSASKVVAHDSTVADLAELRKVSTQRVYDGVRSVAVIV